MFAFHPGVKPALSVRALGLGSAALAALLALSGCASDPNSSTAQNAGVAPQTVAQAADVEADGLPAQTPPPARVRLAPDDPNEPFSRNYGGINPSAVTAPQQSEPEAAEPPPAHAPPALAAQPVLPADLPADFRRKLVQAMAENE